MKNKILSIILVLLYTFATNAQDYTFSNHNVVPFSLNPSLAGNANNIRFGLNYRQQWPTLGNKYHTVRASYDQNVYKRMCSIGVSYVMDNYAAGVYVTNDIGLVYAHTFQLKEGFFLRLGLQASYFINKLNTDKLVFGDQFDLGTGTVVGNMTEEIENDLVHFVDFDFGIDFNIEGKLNVGAAVYHVSAPENGFQESAANRLDRKYVAHINWVKDLKAGNGLWGRKNLSDTYLFVNGIYQHQADWNQLSLGVGAFVTPLIVGVNCKSDLKEVTYVSFMLGASIKDLQLYYIYDLFTGQKKKNGSWSHELSLIYVIRKKERYPCPVVYW